jgi:hypothetical protein
MIAQIPPSYRAEHGQGGTDTRQRNLHHLFKWLAARYEHADPWAGELLVRYGPVKSRPSTLAEDGRDFRHMQRLRRRVAATMTIYSGRISDGRASSICVLLDF